MYRRWGLCSGAAETTSKSSFTACSAGLSATNSSEAPNAGAKLLQKAALHAQNVSKRSTLGFCSSGFQAPGDRRSTSGRGFASPSSVTLSCPAAPSAASFCRSGALLLVDMRPRVGRPPAGPSAAAAATSAAQAV